MCYSAQVEANYKKYVRMFGAHMDIDEFTRLYFERAEGRLKAKIPKAVDDSFALPQSEAEREIKRLIDQYNESQAKALEEELFKQRARLVAAGRTLQTKPTKAATESKRIAGEKIEAMLRRLDDIRRAEFRARDSLGEEDENIVLQFTPRDGNRMLIASLWSKWTGPCEPDLYSFAAITDEPPPEVAEAGHDRCIVPIKGKYIDAWLNPDPKYLDALYAILDDKERPYYEHKLVD